MYKPTDSIYIPGTGNVKLDEYRVHRALQEYDERLMFGRNEKTGDWCAFVKMPHGQAPMPVLGFGRTIPTPEEAVRRCYKADTKRHGSKIFDQMQAHNARIREAKEKATSEQAEVAAEILDYGYRVMGAHPFPKIYMNRGKRGRS